MDEEFDVTVKEPPHPRKPRNSKSLESHEKADNGSPEVSLCVAASAGLVKASKPERTIQISVHTDLGSKMNLVLCETDTVESIKAQIQSHCGLCSTMQFLIFNGRELVSGTVAENGIIAGCGLRLAVKTFSGTIKSVPTLVSDKELMSSLMRMPQHEIDNIIDQKKPVYVMTTVNGRNVLVLVTISENKKDNPPLKPLHPMESHLSSHFYHTKQTSTTMSSKFIPKTRKHIEECILTRKKMSDIFRNLGTKNKRQVRMERENSWLRRRDVGFDKFSSFRDNKERRSGLRNIFSKKFSLQRNEEQGKNCATQLDTETAQHTKRTHFSKASERMQACHICGKRLGVVVPFVCRCKKVLCTSHRNFNKHNCTYNYKDRLL